MGHNVSFDLDFLKALATRHGKAEVVRRALSYHKVDTVAAAIFFDFVLWEKLNGSYKLTALTERFKITHSAAHSADSDIDATIDLFKVMRNALRPEGAAQLAALAAEAAPEKSCSFFSKVAGDWVINFGKYKGKAVTDVVPDDPGYVKWMLKKLEDLSKEQREFLTSTVEKIASF
jgi:DNA polymerase III alpha subunit (gram-positive type)